MEPKKLYPAAKMWSPFQAARGALGRRPRNIPEIIENRPVKELQRETHDTIH